MMYALNRIRRRIVLDQLEDSTPLRRAALLSTSANEVLHAEAFDSCFKTNHIPHIIRKLAALLVVVEKVAMSYGYSIPELIELAAEDLA